MSAKNTFYLTTAIDYTNAAPHLGHAYEKVLADAIARAMRLSGKKVFFLTGVDQHGQKIQQSAEKAGRSPQAHVDEITQLFKALWVQLDVVYDGWAATTDDLHKAVVQGLLQKLHDQGEIYKKPVKGWYSVRAEQFITEKERQADGSFGAEWGQVEEREEENYYFTLAKHVPWLISFLEKNQGTVFPESRQTQLLKSLSDETPDLCISRPKSRLSWGIELPFDREFVTYVWFDALTNYISFAGYDPCDGKDPRINAHKASLPKFEEIWPCDAHIIGKDILVPAHGVYWLIMLHAAGFPDEWIPKILVHGWWNLKNKEGQSEKMSKSLGNVVDPAVLATTFGADCVRYYLLADMSTGQDADFDHARLRVRYDSELKNKIGNLLNRSLNMTNRYAEGKIASPAYDDAECQTLRAAIGNLKEKYLTALETWQFNRAIEAVVEAATATNEFVDRTAPFKLAKDPEKRPQLEAILAHIVEASVQLSVYLEPIIPRAAAAMQTQLGWQRPANLTFADLIWGLTWAGHTVGQGSPLFPPLPIEEETA